MPLAKKENFNSRDPLWAIIISVVMASVVMVYPVSYGSSGWRPAFMLLVMLFWVMCQPAWCGVWFALALGMFTDLVLELPLGLNAISYITIAFFARYLTREKRIMTIVNLWMITAIAVTFHLLFMWLLLVMSGDEVAIIRHWQPWLTSILFWPFIYYGLKKWRAV